MELEWIGDGEREKTKDEQNTEKKAKIAGSSAGEVYASEVNSWIEKKDSRLGMQTRDSKKFLEKLTWLTSNEAADYLRLPSVGALRVLVCKRRVPFHKLGRSLRFKRAELECLLESSKNGGH
jgi:excisionase family DNA binding protein